MTSIGLRTVPYIDSWLRSRYLYRQDFLILLTELNYLSDKRETMSWTTERLGWMQRQPSQPPWQLRLETQIRLEPSVCSFFSPYSTNFLNDFSRAAHRAVHRRLVTVTVIVPSGIWIVCWRYGRRYGLIPRTGTAWFFQQQMSTAYQSNQIKSLSVDFQPTLGRTYMARHLLATNITDFFNLALPALKSRSLLQLSNKPTLSKMSLPV